MRARCLNPYELATLLIRIWDDKDADLDLADHVLAACNLLLYNDELLRLYHKCLRYNVSYEWTVQALVWKLNNIPSWND
jgi:hypothetical protein